MKRVLAITSGLQQASARLRMGALIEPLRERRIDLHLADWPKGLFRRRALLRSAADVDAVILQRRLLDPVHARLLRRRAKRVFLDVDDAVMYHARPVGFFSRWRTDRRFAATCGIVDHVVAGNAYLADIFQQGGCVTSLLPTCVDPRRYQLRQHQPTNEPRLVWIGGRSTFGYLQGIAAALQQAKQQVPGLRLTVVGDRAWDAAPLPCEFVPWSESAEVTALAGSDIGIAPTPDDRWTRGKCGFKIVQYLAAGLPAIASPVGANATIVTPETGLLADTTEAWTAAIVDLCSDADRRMRLGAAGRRDVWSIYNTELAADHWARLLREAG